MFSPPIFIAFKYILSKKHKFLPSLSFLTSFFGVFLSVFALVSVLSVMEGFKQEFERNILGLNSHIKVYFKDGGRSFSPILNYKEETSLLKDAIPNVNGGIDGEAIISDSSGRRLIGVAVRGLEKESFYARELLIKKLRGHFKERGEIVIGKELAFALGVTIGDEINLISPQFRKTPFGSIPIHKTYKVGGIFDVGMYFYDSSFVFVDILDGLAFFQKKGADYLDIILQDHSNLEATKKYIQQTFGPSKVRIIDWRSENESFIQAINLQKSVMFFILMMFLALSSFIVFSGLSSLVTQKNRTTAILRTIGFSRAQVGITFFSVGAFASIPAIILGSTLGALFVLNLEKIKNWLELITKVKIFDGAYYFLSYIPSKIELHTIVQISLFSLCLCFIAILIPAIRAMKSEPADALKWE